MKTNKKKFPISELVGIFLAMGGGVVAVVALLGVLFTLIGISEVAFPILMFFLILGVVVAIVGAWIVLKHSTDNPAND